MPTVVVGTLDTAGFPLAESLDREPTVEFECERVATAGSSATALVWSYAPGDPRVDDLLEADRSVGDWEAVASLADAALYRLDLVRDLGVLRQVVDDAGATILDGYGTATGWRLCLAYPDDDGLRSTRSFCASEDLSFDVQQVRTLPSGPLDRHGLSEPQHEALTVAWRMGYFDVPRTVDLGAVADELGVSHQAASERLRRGQETLVRELLGADARARLPGL